MYFLHLTELLEADITRYIHKGETLEFLENVHLYKNYKSSTFRKSLRNKLFKKLKVNTYSGKIIVALY